MVSVMPSTSISVVEISASTSPATLKKEQQQRLYGDSERTGMTAETSSPITELPIDSERTSGTNTASSQDNSTESNSNNIENETKLSQRRVNFDSIMIREYDRTLGDNPATTHGPPLTLDWQYEDVSPIKLDEYEEQRAPRRITHQMMIPGNTREAILLSQTPTTKKQIQTMVSEVKSHRHQRQVTVAMQDFEEWHEVFELITRRFRRLRKGVSKQREQEQLWEQAHHYQKHKESQLVHKDGASEDSTDDGCVESCE
ncbi:MAG: hypothetical protein SGILL_001427 [Bacillariaceae sp.]